MLVGGHNLVEGENLVEAVRQHSYDLGKWTALKVHVESQSAVAADTEQDTDDHEKSSAAVPVHGSQEEADIAL